MPQGDVETFHKDGEWFNRVEGTDEITEGYKTKGQAAEVGREMAKERKAEHIIRNLDGQIGNATPTANDPRDIPG
jgi:hypothetical protein